MDGKKSIFIFITHSGVSAMKIKYCEHLVICRTCADVQKYSNVGSDSHIFPTYLLHVKMLLFRQNLRNNFENLKKPTEVWISRRNIL